MHFSHLMLLQIFDFIGPAKKYVTFMAGVPQLEVLLVSGSLNIDEEDRERSGTLAVLDDQTETPILK